MIRACVRSHLLPTKNRKCAQAYEQNRSVAKITDFADVPKNSEAQLAAAVSKQPVSVAIEADQAVFQHYKSGILSGDCGTKVCRQR